jgi:hypothetical protein
MLLAQPVSEAASPLRRPACILPRCPADEACEPVRERPSSAEIDFRRMPHPGPLQPLQSDHPVAGTERPAWTSRYSHCRRPAGSRAAWSSRPSRCPGRAQRRYGCLSRWYPWHLWWRVRTEEEQGFHPWRSRQQRPCYCLRHGSRRLAGSSPGQLRLRRFCHLAAETGRPAWTWRRPHSRHLAGSRAAWSSHLSRRPGWLQSCPGRLSCCSCYPLQQWKARIGEERGSHPWKSQGAHRKIRIPTPWWCPGTIVQSRRCNPRALRRQ